MRLFIHENRSHLRKATRKGHPKRRILYSIRAPAFIFIGRGLIIMKLNSGWVLILDSARLKKT